MRTLTIILTLAACLCAGCLSVHEYDPNSELHSEQAVRNAEGVNNGLSDAEIDVLALEAYSMASGTAEGDVDVESPEYQAFLQKVREWAVSDIEVEIDVNQAKAWLDYERAKAPTDDDAD